MVRNFPIERQRSFSCATKQPQHRLKLVKEITRSDTIFISASGLHPQKLAVNRSIDDAQRKGMAPSRKLRNRFRKPLSQPLFSRLGSPSSEESQGLQ